jgi:hypothetical protein
VTVDTIHILQSTAEYLPSFQANKPVAVTVVKSLPMAGDLEHEFDAFAGKLLSDIFPVKQRHILGILHAHPIYALFAKFRSSDATIPIAAIMFVLGPAGMKRIGRLISVAAVLPILQHKAAQ